MGVTSRWINPNAVPLTQDRFSDNGTFSAAKEGKYGYNKVSVGVSEDRVIGKDPDTDEDKEVREEPEPKDPYRPDEGGGGGGGDEKPPHLVETVLPSQIVIVKPPKRTHYLMGETIDYSGIEVQARLKSGAAWDGFPNGMIPFNELIFPIKKLGDPYIPEYRDSGTTHVDSVGNPKNLAVAYEMPNVFDEMSYRWDRDELQENFAEALRAFTDLLVDANNRVEIKIYSYQELGYPDVINRRDFVMPLMEVSYAAHVPSELELGSSLRIVSISRFVAGVTYYDTRIGPDQSVLRWWHIQGIGITNDYRSTWNAFEGSKTETYEEPGEPTFFWISEVKSISTINADFGTQEDGDAIPIYTATSDLDCGIAQPIRFSDRGVAVCAPETEGESRHRETHFSGGRIALAPRGNAICYITASAGGGSMDIVDKWIDEDAGSESEESETVRTDSQFTYDGRTVHYARGSVAMGGAIASYLPDTSGDGAALLQHAGEIAWTMVYGNVASTDKALPVQWSRPGDGKVLETEFNISVAVPVE